MFPYIKLKSLSIHRFVCNKSSSHVSLQLFFGLFFQQRKLNSLIAVAAALQQTQQHMVLRLHFADSDVWRRVTDWFMIAGSNSVFLLIPNVSALRSSPLFTQLSSNHGAMRVQWKQSHHCTSLYLQLCYNGIIMMVRVRMYKNKDHKSNGLLFIRVKWINNWSIVFTLKTKRNCSIYVSTVWRLDQNHIHWLAIRLEKCTRRMRHRAGDLYAADAVANDTVNQLKLN